MNDKTSPTSSACVRLDKWLWAARFFKTRALAKAAIEGGKVHCAGERCKPSKEPKIGDELLIRQVLMSAWYWSAVYLLCVVVPAKRSCYTAKLPTALCVASRPRRCVKPAR